MDRPSSVRTAAASALLLALLTGAAGCGASERDRARDRVDAYVERERDLMQRAQPEFERANDAYLAYARGDAEPEAAARDAAAAERAIRDARDGVALLDPPAEAQPLHDDLVRYLQLNVDVARETLLLARYVPAAERALRPLGRANRRLESRLAGAEESGPQASALQRFSGVVGGTLGELRGLDPPTVLEPAHAEQVRRLAVTRRLAGRLRRALLDRDAARVARLLERFRDSAGGRRPRRLPAERALAQYERRLRQLDDAHAAVQREQTELHRSLR